MTTARVLADPRVWLGAGTAALGLAIDAELTLVKEKAEPKGLCYRDLGPWPVPAGTDQRRIEHPIA